MDPAAYTERFMDMGPEPEPRPLEAGIVVHDLERQVRFYRDGLSCTEFRRVELPDAIAEQSGLGSALTLVLMRTPAGEGIKLLRPHGAPPTSPAAPENLTARRGVAYLTFDVADLEAAVGRLVAAGATLRSARQRVQLGSGTALVFLDDPEGNTIELVERAASPAAASAG